LFSYFSDFDAMTKDAVYGTAKHGKFGVGRIDHESAFVIGEVEIIEDLVCILCLTPKITRRAEWLPSYNSRTRIGGSST
jgi:hypothetical protein